MDSSSSSSTTVAQYLLTRLKQIGVDHLFGVPGDFCLGFLNQVLDSDVQFIGTCNELNAAYAADGYARLKRAGAFVSTYAVGELSALNGVAGSFAERVPVIAITGAPATSYFQTRPLLHHTLGDYAIPSKMFQLVTVASAMLIDGKSAPEEIDRVLSACLAHQQPVYICLPSDVVNMPCKAPTSKFEKPQQMQSVKETLDEALDEAVEMLSRAQNPVVIGDVELIRYDLQREFSALIEKSGFPYATMMLGKCVLDESNPQFIGLYQGDRSRTYVRDRIENADCVLQLGMLPTDLNTGGFSVQLQDERIISASFSSVRIKRHIFPNLLLKDFIVGLTSRISHRSFDIHAAIDSCVHRPSIQSQLQAGNKLTVARFFDRISRFFKSQSVVIAETGVALFSASETLMPKGASFIGQTFYGSIGYTVGATLGASIAAASAHRPVVALIGDGSFQVTCQDLSTMLRQKLTPVIFLLNNDGYTIERVISDQSYNDIQPWKYHQLVEAFGGGGVSFNVYTEGELESALKEAEQNTKQLVFIEVHTEKMDCSDSLREAGKGMAKNTNVNERQRKT